MNGGAEKKTFKASIFHRRSISDVGNGWKNSLATYWRKFRRTTTRFINWYGFSIPPPRLRHPVDSPFRDPTRQ